MNRFFQPYILALGLLTPFAIPVAAEILSSTSPSIRANLCVGGSCLEEESFSGDFNQVVVKASNTRILFDDATTIDTFASDHWALQANERVFEGRNQFMLKNDTLGTIPVTVQAGAGTHALFLATGGNVGLGTSIPQAPLQVETTSTGGIRLNRSNAGLGGQSWETVIFSNGDFGLSDVSNTTTPFAMRPGTPNNAIFLEDDTAQINAGSRDYNFEVRWDNGTSLWADGGTGNIGIGTTNPEEVFHIRTVTPNTDAFALFDAAGSGSDAAFLLRQQGIIPTTWEFRNQQDSGRLNVGIAGGNTPLKIDNAANNNLLRLGRNGLPGEVNITGTLVVNNTQLNVPDYVFDADYPLRPLAEVQAFIDENSHLPEVPSQAEITANGVDMTEMQMVLLKKVEELTLYTLEQDAMIAALHEKAAQSDAQAQLITSLQLRLEALEATR